MKNPTQEALAAEIIYTKERLEKAQKKLPELTAELEAAKEVAEIIKKRDSEKIEVAERRYLAARSM